jgi:3-oxoacyl-[acyl-carrier protein] reductase
VPHFDNRVALITGGGSGIGQASAVTFAERGADVVILDINADGADETVQKVNALGRRAKAIEVDVADVKAVHEAVEEAEAHFGHIDLLLNNAGIGSDRCPLEDVTEDLFDRMFGVHVKATVFTTQAVIPGMKERGFGKIVNISSIQAMSAYANGATYNGAKGAILAISKGWAKEFSPWKINVNIVAPGHCLTPMPISRGDTPEILAEKAKSVPFGRYGTAEEMAYSIAFLCSPEAEFITGQVISPNGGFSIVGI